MPTRLQKFITQKLQTRWQVDLGRASDVIFVAGSGRSGTTWLGNIIAAATNSRTIFEPFLHDQLRQFVTTSHHAEHQIDRQISLNPDAETCRATEQHIDAILAGHLRTDWTEQQSQAGIFHGRIIKAIRANLMLGWLARRHPEMKMIWIVRDPVSVIHSQLRKIDQGWQFCWQPEFVLSQPDLIQRHLQPFQERIKTADTLIEQLACKWCIETYVPLRECKDCQNVLRIGYAQLTKSTHSWHQLATFLQPAAWSNVAATRVAGQRSFTSCDRSGSIASAAMKPGEIKIIQKIVSEFALEQFTESPAELSATSAA